MSGVFIYLHCLWKVDLSWVSFFLSFIFFIHYSIILSAGTTSSPRTLHHFSPTTSKKSLWNLGPSLTVNTESFCFQTLIIHASLLLYIWENLLHPCHFFQDVFCPPSPHTCINPLFSMPGLQSCLAIRWDRTLLEAGVHPSSNNFLYNKFKFTSKWY